MGAVLGRMPMPEAKLIKAVVDDVFATQLLSARAQTAEAPAAAPPRQSFLSRAVAALFRLNNGELVPSGEAGRPAAAVQALPLQHVAAPTSEREAFRVELLNLIENSLRRDADTHTAALLQSYQGHLESLAEPFSTGLSADVQERGAALGRRLHQRVTALRQRFPDVVMQPPLLAQLRGGKEAVDIVRRDAATEKSADACGYYCNNTSGATCSRGGTVGCMYGGGPAWGPNGVRVEGDGRGAKGRCKTKGHCAPRKRDGVLLFCCEHYPDGVPCPPPAAARHCRRPPNPISSSPVTALWEQSLRKAERRSALASAASAAPAVAATFCFALRPGLDHKAPAASAALCRATSRFALKGDMRL